jgi:hypothetical protein
MDHIENIFVSSVVVQLLQVASNGLHNTVSNSNSIVVEACLQRRCAARRAQARDAEKLKEHGASQLCERQELDRGYADLQQETANVEFSYVVENLTLAVSSGEVKRMPCVFPEDTLMQTLWITFLFPQFAALSASDELI